MTDKKMTGQTMTDRGLDARWQKNAAAQRARFADYTLDPAHTIALEPHKGVAKVVWNGVVIAESANAIELHERKHEPVLYFPPGDVDKDLLQRTDHATHCPYKGDASYWSLKSGDAIAENAVWAYESPIAAMDGIQGHMAFYLDSMGKDYGLVIQND